MKSNPHFWGWFSSLSLLPLKSVYRNVFFFFSFTPHPIQNVGYWFIQYENSFHSLGFLRYFGRTGQENLWIFHPSRGNVKITNLSIFLAFSKSIKFFLLLVYPWSVFLSFLDSFPTYFHIFPLPLFTHFFSLYALLMKPSFPLFTFLSRSLHCNLKTGFLEL